MLYQGHDTVGHEPATPHGLARPGDLGHLHDAAGGRHLHVPARLAGVDLERLHAGPDVDHDLDPVTDRKSTRLNSSHVKISYAVFCLKKKTDIKLRRRAFQTHAYLH